MLAHTTLSKRVALVAGASGSIGQAVVQTLADAGATVLFTYGQSRDAMLHDIAGELVRANANGGSRRVAGYQLDAHDPTAFAGLLDLVAEQYGHIDALIIVGGEPGYRTVAMTEETWQQASESGLNALAGAVRPAARLMRQRGAAVVTVASMAAGREPATATTRGMADLTRDLAKEFAADGIRVNAVAPGLVEADMGPDLHELAGSHLLQRILLRRYGRPEEVAGAVLFLASELSSYVNGTVIPVDGGAFGGELGCYGRFEKSTMEETR